MLDATELKRRLIDAMDSHKPSKITSAVLARDYRQSSK